MVLLITGSTGFVGRNLLLRVTQDPRWRQIVLPVRDPAKLRAQLAGEGIVEDERVLICQVTGDSWELPNGVRPDLVIHAAGLLFGRRKEDYHRTNVDGSIRLAEQLPRTARMIALSSLAAGGPTPEDAEARGMHHADRPVSLYGSSKLTMEGELRHRLGSRLLILRPPMVLGPRDAATLPLFKMAAWAIRIKPGFAAKHYSWVDVGELCEALTLLAAADSPDWENQGTFYLGSEQLITDTELIATAASLIGGRGVTLSAPQAAIQLASLVIDSVPSWRAAAPSLGRDRVREILPGRWVSDGRPFAEQFGWRPTKHLRQTLGETAEWLRQQGKI
jgi:nucleoside-diphosphate-sugar epimerase